MVVPVMDAYVGWKKLLADVDFTLNGADAPAAWACPGVVHGPPGLADLYPELLVDWQQSAKIGLFWN